MTLLAVMLVTVAAGCGNESSEARRLTASMVQKAFAAEGLPLKVLFSQLKTEPTILTSNDGKLSEELSVMVFQKLSTSYGVRAGRPASHRFILVKNVLVNYAPRSDSVAKIRAAVKRLRKLR